jgi:hypothetical protein
LSNDLGWAAAELSMNYLIYFFYEASGDEFKWDFILTAIQTNFELVCMFLIY